MLTCGETLNEHVPRHSCSNFPDNQVDLCKPAFRLDETQFCTAMSFVPIASVAGNLSKVTSTWQTDIMKIAATGGVTKNQDDPRVTAG